jgi:hypothetical protein
MFQRRRRKPSIAKELRADIRGISRKYRDQLSADLELKARVLRLARALWPPRPRRRASRETQWLRAPFAYSASFAENIQEKLLVRSGVESTRA